MTETKSSAKMTDITEKREIFADPAIRKQLKITTISRDTPVYIEIYRRIQRLIRQNLLQFGDQLPGEHELAAIMGVGRTSLRTALSILYEDGYIRTRKGKGSFVADNSRMKAGILQEWKGHFNSAVEEGIKVGVTAGEMKEMMDTACRNHAMERGESND